MMLLCFFFLNFNFFKKKPWKFSDALKINFDKSWCVDFELNLCMT